VGIVLRCIEILGTCCGLGIATVAAVIHKRARQLPVIAVVAALHIVVCWVLLESTGPLKIRTASSSLELIYLTLDVPDNVARRPAPARSAQPLVRQGAATRPLSQPSQAIPGEEDNAIHPPIDWANELDRAARESASAAAAPRPREFGVPHIAPAPPKPPEFGWSHSRTHRVETGPGGLAVHFGDNCVISFTPVPFPICTVGRNEANGDLFKHMRDPPQPGDWKDPQ
jgi:hypothetical protein